MESDVHTPHRLDSKKDIVELKMLSKGQLKTESVWNYDVLGFTTAEERCS